MLQKQKLPYFIAQNDNVISNPNLTNRSVKKRKKYFKKGFIILNLGQKYYYLLKFIMSHLCVSTYM